MTKNFIAILALGAAACSAFAPTQVPKHPYLFAASDEIDFDAPADRASAVGNVVRTPPTEISVGPFSVGVPSFIAKAMGLTPTSKKNNEDEGDFDLLMAMDDECYLGKDGDLEDCADFDPLP